MSEKIAVEGKEDMNQVYTAVGKGSSIEVFNAKTGIRLYTIAVGHGTSIVGGPYVSGDTMTAFVKQGNSTYLKTFNVTNGVCKSTVAT
ncbi:MAG TPA: hypothetical protein VMB22_00110 [Verrucomicrobiae bacterium]|nr:hypothetical protein [Verrucomicrobiae bacterium]